MADPIDAVALGLSNLAHIQDGDWLQARNAARASLAGLPADARVLRGQLMLVLACATLRDGDSTEADEAMAAVCEACDSPVTLGTKVLALTERAVIAGLQGRRNDAASLYGEAGTACRQAGLTCPDRWYLEQAQWLAEIHRHQEALELLADGIDAFARSGDVTCQALLRLQRAVVQCETGQCLGIADEIEAVEAIEARDASPRVALAASAARLALLLAERRDPDAPAMQRRLLALPATPFADPGAFRFRFDVARLALICGEPLQARAILEPLSAWLERASFTAWQARTVALLCQLRALPTRQAMALPSRHLARAPSLDRTASDPRLRCFGEVDIQDSAGIGLLGGRRSRIVLAMLLSNSRGASRDQLVDALYGDHDVLPKALSVLVSRLRASLSDALPDLDQGSLIRWAEGRYTLDAGVWQQSELFAFDQAHSTFEAAGDDAARAMAAERLVLLYRGPVFGEFSEQPWALLIHARTQEHWVSAALWLHERLLAMGESANAVMRLDRLLEIAPLCAALHVAKITTLCHIGKVEAARVQETVMKRLIGTPPSQVPWYANDPGKS